MSASTVVVKPSQVADMGLDDHVGLKPTASTWILGSTVEDFSDAIARFEASRGLSIQPVGIEHEDKITAFRELIRSKHSDKINEYFVRSYGGEVRCFQRFLSARDMDQSKAEKLLLEAIEMKREVGADDFDKIDMMESVDLQKKYNEFTKTWPLQFWGFTRFGNLVSIAKLSNVYPREFLKRYSEDEMKKFFIHHNEKILSLQNFGNTFPFREFLPEKMEPNQRQWRRTIEIFDLKSIGFAQLHVSGLKQLVRVLKLGQIIFPDNLLKCFIINAPMFFSAAWNVVKLGLNSDTLAKVVITRGDARKELTELLGSEQLVDDLLKR